MYIPATANLHIPQRPFHGPVLCTRASLCYRRLERGHHILLHMALIVSLSHHPGLGAEVSGG
eukprot:10954369-Alexandrium_andersonii.AAC.1